MVIQVNLVIVILMRVQLRLLDNTFSYVQVVGLPAKEVVYRVLTKRLFVIVKKIVTMEVMRLQHMLPVMLMC